MLKYLITSLCSLLLISCGSGDLSKNNKEEQIAIASKDKASRQLSGSTEAKPNIPKTSSTFNNVSMTAFETCLISDELLATREYLIKNTKAVQTYDGYLTYKIKADFLGLPIKEVIFGVCSEDKPLSKDCSFVEDIAFILDIDFDKAKNILQNSKGIDFTKAKRSKFTEAADGPTLRPILYKGADGSTVLHCDTGGL